MSGQLLETLPDSRFFGRLQGYLEERRSVFLEKLPSSFIARLACELFESRDILIITGKEFNNHLFQDLRFFLGDAVLAFPSWETNPEEIAPSMDIVGRRLSLLSKMHGQKERRIMMTSLHGFMQKVVHPSAISKASFSVRCKEEIDYAFFYDLLEELGYHKSKVVINKGEYALRGGIIDLFPISSSHPYRIEFELDNIASIRRFDPISQVSEGEIDSFALETTKETGVIASSSGSLLSYFHDPILVFEDLLEVEDHLADMKATLDKSPFFFSIDRFFELIAGHVKIFITAESHAEFEDETHAASFFNHTFEGQLLLTPTVAIDHFFQIKEPKELFEKVANFTRSEYKWTFVIDQGREKEKLLAFLPDHLKESSFVEGYLASGFVFVETREIVLPYSEFTHQYRLFREKQRDASHVPLSSFHELEIGDFVVHLHSGIGKYLGIEKQKNAAGEEREFIAIEYQNKGMLYVPISQSHLVNKYIGAGEASPPLSELGSSKWQKIKARTEGAIIGYAQDLLELHARRELEGGFAFPPDSTDFQEFETAFPYVETPDQLAAIDAVKKDMYENRPMDRLILGDVGYGKTEVAMRAAAKAVLDAGKQVAILVPTTVLAMQHYENFKERVALFPINVGIVSRFQNPREVQGTLQKLQSGGIDILIGTHRLLSPDIIFKDLGLIIIDEEQRFGVRAKEALRKFKFGVDALTLSATPIPRTLYLSLIQARSMSTISSPPLDRLPIKTIIAEREDALIRDALILELSRDGQAYYIHNRVETIDAQREWLQTLLPTARIKVVHGQMPSESIDTIFHAFKIGEIDILVATSIVENGIDIPNANTIIINRAHHFGISDLYQLRGRVGRWSRSSFAYFLIPKRRELPELTLKRLSALAETSGFGGGARLAMRDLELRGAGDILGTKQSGHVSSIGFHLYCKLLKKTIDALQNRKEISFIETKIDFPFPAELPESYINDKSLRLELYHRLGEVTTLEQIDTVFYEIKDRFGRPPLPVLWLYHMTRIRIIANRHHIKTLRYGAHTLEIEVMQGKKTETKGFMLPPKKAPHEVEEFTASLIAKIFR